MSTPASPFDRLSRRSRYEALLSQYEAAAEVVRTHADTDVQLQPQDQPIAEEEPQQLLPSPSDHPTYHLHHHHDPDHRDGSDQEAPPPPGPPLPQQQPPPQLQLAARASHLSIGGAAPATLSPGLPRRGSAAALYAGGLGSGGGSGGGGAPPEDIEHGGYVSAVAGDLFAGCGDVAGGGGGGGFHGDADEAPPRERSIASGGGGGGLAAGLSGAFGGLASLAGLHLGGGGGGGGGSPFTAAAAEAHGAGELFGDGGGDGGGGGGGEGGGGAAGAPARKHRERAEKPKKPPLLSSNWLKVDYKGMDTIIRVDRHKLMHKLGVQARDLRLLDLTSATPPAILDRDKAIIVNLWHIRAIITLDYCLVVSPDAIADAAERRQVVTFVELLKGRLAADHCALGEEAGGGGGGGVNGGGGGGGVNGGGGGKGRPYVGLSGAAGHCSLQLPFELKVLEVCLDMTASQLDQATKMLEGEAYLVLEALTRKVTAVNLEKARRIKNRLVRLTKNVESVREVLERFLNDDGDMHRLHLTGAELSRQISLRPAELGRLSAGMLPGGASSVADSDSSSDSSIDEAETAAVEMLLEAYFMQVDHSFNRLQTLHEYIKDTEDLVTIQLDQHRNQLITVDLTLTSLTLACGLMTVVGGFFGMNLNSNLQEAPHIFNAVVWATTLGSLVLWVAFLVFLHKQFGMGL